MALLYHQAIIDKGVTEIAHRQRDYYYRSLLCVPQDKLKQFIAENLEEAKANEWLRQKAFADGDGDMACDSEDDVAAVPALELPALGDVVRAAHRSHDRSNGHGSSLGPMRWSP